MKSLLVDLLNDIISGCNKFLTTLDSSETSKDSACNRLKLVLMHDRTKLPPHMLEQMRDELVDVISKYVEIDKELLDLNLASEGNSIALMASIPVLRAKVQDEESQETEASENNDEASEKTETEGETSEENSEANQEVVAETTESEQKAEETSEASTEQSETPAQTEEHVEKEEKSVELPFS